MNSSFLERGGLWVVSQSVLMAGVVVLAIGYPGELSSRSVMAIGFALLAIGAFFGLAGVAALKGNRTAFPKPREQSNLIQRGIYAHVRHPLYTSVILVSVGWALVWRSWVALALGLIMLPFFHAKTKVEERWLRDKFPEYERYQQRVRRFIPWVY